MIQRPILPSRDLFPNPISRNSKVMLDLYLCSDGFKPLTLGSAVADHVRTAVCDLLGGWVGHFDTNST